jgi:hypothetical protein
MAKPQMLREFLCIDVPQKIGKISLSQIITFKKRKEPNLVTQALSSRI